MSEREPPTLRCQRLKKTFLEAEIRVEVLRDVNLTVFKGETVAVVGASGSGKSTLLHLLGGLDRPSGGEVVLCGQSLATLGEKARGALRNRSIGFVYQFHHLLPEFSALENVAMPLLIRGENHEVVLTRATELLKKVGLGTRLEHKPAELSGGERQRTAVARAMVTRPECILADEPTGNLDRATAVSLHQLMLDLNQEFGTSLVMATHDLELAGRLDRQYRLINGALEPLSD